MIKKIITYFTNIFRNVVDQSEPLKLEKKLAGLKKLKTLNLNPFFKNKIFLKRGNPQNNADKSLYRFQTEVLLGNRGSCPRRTPNTDTVGPTSQIIMMFVFGKWE